MADEKVPLTEEAFAKITQKMEEDPALAEAFKADPGAVLAAEGYYITDEIWDIMNTALRSGVAAVVSDVREQVPTGNSKATTVTVSIDNLNS